eukprot:837684-Pelagomonas_calceolata.AAC.1
MCSSVQPGSLGDKLVRHTGPWPMNLPIKHSRRVPLEGAELVEWEKQRAMEVDMEDAAPALPAISQAYVDSATQPKEVMVDLQCSVWNTIG